MEVKPGYKQTEVGVIPEEWDAVALGKFISLQRGHDLTWRDRKDGEVPVMGSAGQNGFHNTPISRGPGVVLGRSGASFGQAHYCEQDFWPHNTALYVTDFQDNDRLFVFYFLRSIDFSRHNSGGAQQSLNRNFIAPIKVGVPRPPEQRAIATALSDVDGLLGGLDRLIAKKRDLKQAAMQQLLTGQTRLPGFHGEWEETTLGEVATFLSGGTPSRSNDDYWMGDIPWISASSLRCFEIWRSDSNVTKEAVAAGSKMAPVGSSLLLVRGSALHNEILCGLVTQPVCFNQDVKALVPRSQVVPKFLTLFIRGTAEEFLKLVSSAGNTAGVLDTKLLKAFAINLPPLPEQTAIAEVLTEMDAELAVLEQRGEKTRALKQAMMQELLTGRTRLL